MSKLCLKIFVIFTSLACSAEGTYSSRRTAEKSSEPRAEYGIVASEVSEIKSVEPVPDFEIPDGMKFYGYSKEEVLNLCQSGERKITSHKILVPETNGCKFNSENSLEKKESFFQAVVKQKASINLPASAVICEVVFHSSGDQIQYKDDFAVTFQDVLLFSSFDMNHLFQEFKGLFLFDWNQLKGKRRAESDDSYCIGACRYPERNKKGRFSAFFDVTSSPDLAFALVTSSFIQSKLGKPIKGDIGIYVTGDRDDDDCSHTEAVVTVDIEHVELVSNPE